jgi:membrane associated rhomboid family serine protease
LIVAAAAALAWTVKALVIWEAGGLDKSSLEAPFFGIGFVTYLIAWALLGVAATSGRRVGARVAAAVGGAVAGFALMILLDSLAAVLPSSTGWVEEEAGLWAAALITLGVAWLIDRRDGSEVVAVATT